MVLEAFRQSRAKLEQRNDKSTVEASKDSASSAPATSGRDVDVDDVIEEFILWAQTAFGNDEIVTAREEFFKRSGKVFSDDSHFASHMSYFLDFFLFERPLSTKVC